MLRSFWCLLLAVTSFTSSAHGQTANDLWAEAIILSIDPSSTQQHIDDRFRSAVLLSQRKADILLCKSDLRIALGLLRKTIQVVDQAAIETTPGTAPTDSAVTHLNHVIDSLSGDSKLRTFELLVALKEHPRSPVAWLRILVNTELQGFESAFRSCVEYDAGNAMPFYVKAIRYQQMGAPVHEVIDLLQQGHKCDFVSMHPTPIPETFKMKLPAELTNEQPKLKGMHVPPWVLRRALKSAQQMRWTYEGQIHSLLTDHFQSVPEDFNARNLNTALLTEYEHLGQKLLWEAPSERLFMTGVIVTLRSTLALKKHYSAVEKPELASAYELKFRRVKELSQEVFDYEENLHDNAGDITELLKKNCDPDVAVLDFIQAVRPKFLQNSKGNASR